VLRTSTAGVAAVAALLSRTARWKVSDLVHNTLGAAVGAGLAVVLLRRHNRWPAA
jgi:glycopeptide antibiotics resistance protein